MSNAALEALALGTPVIGCSEAGGIVELSNEAPPGAVTVARDEIEFINAMKSVIKTREAGGAGNSLLPVRFNLARVVFEYETICLGQPSRSTT